MVQLVSREPHSPGVHTAGESKRSGGPVPPASHTASFPVRLAPRLPFGIRRHLNTGPPALKRCWRPRLIFTFPFSAKGAETGARSRAQGRRLFGSRAGADFSSIS